MHCATLDIKAKVDYTLVPFMLSFRCPAVFLPCMPFILRSNALLLIFSCVYMFCAIRLVLRVSVSLAISTSVMTIY